MATISQRSLAGGEISPALYGRCDVSKYLTSLRIMRNAIIPKHGGGFNRAGTNFVGDATFGELVEDFGGVRLIPFRFNDSQTYCLEFSDHLIRFIQNGAYITLASKVISAISSSGTVEITISSHGYLDGDQVFLKGVPGILNGATFIVSVVDTNNFNIYPTADNATLISGNFSYSSGGTAQKIYTVSSPYGASDLPSLIFAQQGDIVTIAHPSYAPKQLVRSGSTSWAINTMTIGPSIAAPATITIGTTGTACYWVVTAISSKGEESVPTSAGGGSFIPTDSGSTISMSVSWAAVSGATGYNIYRDGYGAFGLVGQVPGGSTNFIDNIIEPNYSISPPISANPVSGSGNFPSTVGYIKQRLWFGGSNNNPNVVNASQVGAYSNFNISFPGQDSDAVSFGVVSAQVNTIKNFLDLGNVLIFCDAGEHSALGDSSGSITPTQINLKQYSYAGSSGLQPIAIDTTALFVQGRGSIVRDLTYDFVVNGYHGNDVTEFSNHLFDGYTILDWTYQKIPNSIVWCVRSDGELLGLTYIKSEEIWGWHHHDFQGGKVISVCAVPEGTEDFLYLAIQRVINGNNVIYVERMNSRLIPKNATKLQVFAPANTGMIDTVFMDAALSYDGRKVNGMIPGDAVAISGGTNWTFDESLTLTSANSLFKQSDVGCSYIVAYPDGDITGQLYNKTVRFNITGYTSANTVTGNVTSTVPVSLRGYSTADFTKMVNVVSGLYHLIGQNVSVLGDGGVVASPNNPNYTVLTVDSTGVLTLPNAYGVIHVGLPYLSDIETLDINTASSETLSDKYKIISRVTVRVEESAGMFVGAQKPDNYPNELNATQYLTAPKLKNVNQGYTLPSNGNPVSPPLLTDTFQVNVGTRPNTNGRVFIRQVDPLPMSIVEIIPQGDIPAQGRV